MKKSAINWILSAICLYVLSVIFSGISFSGFASALVAALVLGFINSAIKPVISLFSLPLTIITLGLFSLVINALMLLLASAIVPGFNIAGFGTAFFAAIVLSILNMLFIDDKREIR